MTRFGAAVVALCVFGCGKVKSDETVDASEVDAADTTAPVVTITQKPAAVAPDTATFEWAVDDVSATFQCSLDAGSFADCLSPTTFSALATGNHMFQVLARDPAGNTGMASHSWMVEPPCTPSLIELEAVPTHVSWAVASGGVLHGGQGLETSTVNANFTFDFTGKGLILYGTTGPNRGQISVAIDNGTPLVVNSNAPSVFTFQVPFPIASGLANTTHTAVLSCPTTICAVDYVDATCL